MISDPDFVNLLREEYSIIQAKIDKIGEFKFKVRGWLLTILSALLFGILTDQIPRELSLLTIVTILVFHILEREQIELQYALSKRALEIEWFMNSLDKLKRGSETKKEALDRMLQKRIKSSPRIGLIMTSSTRMNWRSLVARMFNFKKNWLYWLLYALAILIVLFKEDCLIPGAMIKMNPIGNAEINIDKSAPISCPRYGN